VQTAAEAGPFEKGLLRLSGTLPNSRSPLPRRSVLDVCHWQTAPEAAAETLAPLGD